MKVPARFSTLCQGAIIAASLTAADVGRAAPPASGRALSKEAAKLWDDAVAATQADHLTEALHRWRKVWDHMPGEPKVACNIGRGEFRAGRMREAALWLKLCAGLLANATTPKDIEIRRNATLELLVVREQLSTLTIEVHEPDARVVIDDSDIHITPIEDDVFVLPGEHRIQAFKDVRTAWTAITTKPGKEYRVALHLPRPVPTSLVPPGRPPAWYVRNSPAIHEPFRLWPVIVGGSLGLSALAAGTGLYFAGDSAGTDATTLLTAMNKDGVSCTETPIPASCSLYSDLESRRTTYSTASIAMFIASGVFTGGVLAYTIYETRRVLKDSLDEGIVSRSSEAPRFTIATTGTGLIAKYQW